MNSNNHPSFSFPSSKTVTDESAKENEKLIHRKALILTELAAIENNISPFEMLDPARDQLQPAVTDVPCSVVLLKNSVNKYKKKLNIEKASCELASIITDIVNNPKSKRRTEMR